MVILTLLFQRLKYFGRLLQYLCLPPWPNVIKLFIRVIYCHSMVFTVIIMFHNTGWQQYHGMVVNYHGSKFYNISLCFSEISIDCGLLTLDVYGSSRVVDWKGFQKVLLSEHCRKNLATFQKIWPVDRKEVKIVKKRYII